MNEREQLAKDNGMTIEFVNWFFDNKKDGCGNAWFIMMAAMWEGWSGREAKCAALAAEKEKFDVECAATKIAIAYMKSGRQDFTLNTTATDAFLAEVRAQGVEMFGQYHNFSEKLFIQKEAKKFAAKLRQEAAQ